MIIGDNQQQIHPENHRWSSITINHKHGNIGDNHVYGKATQKIINNKLTQKWASAQWPHQPDLSNKMRMFTTAYRYGGFYMVKNG